MTHLPSYLISDFYLKSIWGKVLANKILTFWHVGIDNLYSWYVIRIFVAY